MTFRRFAVSYWSMLVLALVCIAGGGWVLTELYPFSSDDMPVCWMILGSMVVMVLLAVRNPWRDRLFIDARGISCRRGKGVLWSFSWDQIEQIRPVPVLRGRGYVIIPNPDLPSPAASDHTFGHTRRIRTELEKYAAHLLARPD